MEWLESVKASEDPCLRALVRDAVDEMEGALIAGRSIDQKFHFKRTFLHIAAELGSLKCAEMLLRRGAEIEALDEYGRTPLIYAISNRQAAIAAMYLEHGARIEYEFRPPDSPERRANAIADYKKMFAESFKNFASQIPFDVPDTIDEMVEQAVKVTFRTQKIHALDSSFDPDTLRLLVARYGCNPNRHDDCGEWPLKTFAGQGDVAAVEFLLAHGADPNFTSTGEIALHAAVAADSCECANVLLKSGANVNQRDVDGCVPMWRVRSDRMLDLLLAYGADPTMGDQCGFTPSHWVKDDVLKSRLFKLEEEFSRRGGPA